MTSEYDLHLCCQCDQKFMMKPEWELCHHCILNRDAFHYQRGLNDAKAWISVKDRMPDHGNYTLTYAPSSLPPIRIHCYSQFAEQWSRNKGEEITHWQPLPEPPK